MHELNGLGDRKARQAARQAPCRLLPPVDKPGDPQSGRLLLQSNNPDALLSEGAASP